MPLDDRGEKVDRTLRSESGPTYYNQEEKQENVRLRFKKLLADEDRAGLQNLIRECQSGKRQFSAAALSQIETYYREMGLGSGSRSHQECDMLRLALSACQTKPGCLSA